MMTLEEWARNIVNGLVPREKQLLPDDINFTVEQLQLLINDKLEEVAAEVEKLESGTYTATKSAAELVRAMKVK